MLKSHPELHRVLKKRGITDMNLVMARSFALFRLP